MQRSGRRVWLVVARCTPCLILFAGAIATSTAAADPPGTVDVEKSRVYVFVPKKGAGKDHAVEGRIAAGAIHLGRTEPGGELKFELKSFAADTPECRKYIGLEGERTPEDQEEITKDMHSASVLNVARFPTAEFVIARVRPLPVEAGEAGRPYRLEGEFTLHGVQQPLQIDVTTETVDGGNVRLRGKFTLKQTDFGINPFTKLLGSFGVANELQVHGDLYLRP
jgi:hypothetical protein